MSTSSLKPLLISALCALLVACSHRAAEDRAVPRRTAYPRVAEYPAAYKGVDSVPLAIEANASAIASVEAMPQGVVWLNLAYPAYKARVYVTFTPVNADNVEYALENRAERIGLNIGNAEVESEHFTTPSGYYVTLIKSPQSLPAPVHFLAVSPDSPQWLVSGAAVFDGLGPQAPADSIAPAIEAIYRDVSHAMSHLAPLGK